MVKHTNINLQKLKSLYGNIGKLITSTLDFDTALNSIMHEIELFFNPENWSLLRVDPTSQELFFVVVKGIDSAEVKNIRLKIGEGIAGHVALTGETLLVADVQSDPRFSNKVDAISGFVTRSIIAVPIKFQDSVMGVIELINPIENEVFNQEELFILETIGDFAAIAFLNAARYQDLIKLTDYDVLTGAYNRRRLEGVVNNWMQIQSARPVTAVLMDLNKFKEVNDTDGHAAGDRLLRQFTRVISQLLTSDEMLFRIGGDEFLILIPYNNELDSKQVETNIMQRLNNALKDFEHKPGFSYGVISGLQNTTDELINTADKRMYDSKKNQKSGKSN